MANDYTLISSIERDTMQYVCDAQTGARIGLRDRLGNVRMFGGVTASNVVYAPLPPFERDNLRYVRDAQTGAVLGVRNTVDVTRLFGAAVVTAPVVISPPGALSVVAGAVASFAVAYSDGGAPASIQWQRNGTNIAGALSPSYSFTAATGDNGAVYRAVLTNSAGSTTSAGAALTVSASAGDTTAPTFASAQVANASPSVVALTMSEALAGTLSAASAFAVTVNGSARTVSSVAAGGTAAVVNLTLASAVANGDAVTVTYTKPGSNPLADAAGNQTASFGPSSVTNNVAAQGNTAPGAPTGLTLGTATDTTQPLTWTAPASNGGAAITDYVVQRAIAGSGNWTTFADGTSTTAAATVTGLTASTSYDYRVAAVNSVDTGAYSTTATGSTAAPAADTRPRYWYASTQTYPTDGSAAAAFAGATPLTGSANGGETGSFVSAASSTQYIWIAVLQSNGSIRVTEPVGDAGFNGATTAGDYTGPETSPSTSTTVHTDSTGAYLLYRSNYRGISGVTFTLV